MLRFTNKQNNYFAAVIKAYVRTRGRRRRSEKIKWRSLRGLLLMNVFRLCHDVRGGAEDQFMEESIKSKAFKQTKCCMGAVLNPTREPLCGKEAQLAVDYLVIICMKI